MQAWQIIVAGAVAAGIAAVALFLPGAMRSPTGAAALFQTYWLGVAVVWLGVYSIVVLVLNTATVVSELGNAAPGETGRDWPRRFLQRLGATQYFSAVLVLLALALLPVAVAPEPFFWAPAAIGSSPALAFCAMAILVGVLGWLTATVVAAFRTPPVWTQPPTDLSPPDLAAQSVNEMLKLLRARPVEPASAITELAEQLRQRDHSTLEAIKELAGAINRVRNGVSEIQHGLQHRGPDKADRSSSEALADIADVAGELRAATAALAAAVTKLDDIAATLAALSPIGLSAPARGNLPPGSRSQLSGELQELLRDMATGPAPRREGSR